jgi:peptidoglycan/LPS O-acetylase OafA/YrhL
MAQAIGLPISRQFQHPREFMRQNESALSDNPCPCVPLATPHQAPLSTTQAARHQNNFGFLRLLLALLVILSHSFEIIDGNRSRELLTRVFGTISFGEFAVDGFFLISGYLITQSLFQSRSIKQYLFKRVLRIYPGFIIAFFFTYFIVGPLSGGSFAQTPLSEHIKNGFRIFAFGCPVLNNSFPGLHYHFLNGSLWTISYEFRCYLFIIVLSIPFIARNRSFVLLLSIALLGLIPIHSLVNYEFPYGLNPLLGFPTHNLRLIPIFLSGSLFYLFRDRIVYHKSWAFIALAILIPLMFSRWTAELALATLGAYFLFWFAFKVPSRLLSRIGDKTDLSYGVYLYAFPAQMLLLYQAKVDSPWLNIILSTPITLVLAYLSWTFVEKPFLKFKNKPKPA